MALAVQQNIFWFTVSVDNSLLVKMAQTKDDLTSIEPAPLLGKPRLSAHVVDVELEITSLHNS